MPERFAKATKAGVALFSDNNNPQGLLDAGMALASMQVQYSLLDARPENGLTRAGFTVA